MELSAQEVRLGNYHFYHIVDKLDERGEYDEVCQIDAEDFRILENFDCPEYKPIPLDEEWLGKLGFEKLNYIKDYKWKTRLQGKEGRVKIKVTEDGHCCARGVGWVQYVHQLQNLFFALTGEELEINEK